MSRRIGHYEVEGELGRGGMGIVYRARDTRSGGLVALKTLHSDAASQEQIVRFAREGTVLQGIEHPHLVRVIEVHAGQPTPFVAFELVEGETLKAQVLRSGPLAWRDVLAVVRQLADAVGALHANRVLHRDVKPENVLLSPGGVKLADFGLLKALDKETLTRTGASVGTPSFMAPEQVESERGAFTFRTDVYGLAATLYFALTGSPPYDGTSALATLVSVLDAPVPSIRQTNRRVPAWLDAVCQRGMAKLPEDRYSSPEAFVRALQEGAAWANEEPQGRSPIPTVLAAVVAGAGLTAAVLWGLERAAPSAPSGRAPQRAEAERAQREPPSDSAEEQRYPWARFQLPPALSDSVSELLNEQDWAAAAALLREHSESREVWVDAAQALAERLTAEAAFDASPALSQRLAELEGLAAQRRSEANTRALVQAITSLPTSVPADASEALRNVAAQRAASVGVDVLRRFPAERFASARALELFDCVQGAPGSALEPGLVWELVTEVYTCQKYYPAGVFAPLVAQALAYPLPEEHPGFSVGIPRLAALCVRQQDPDLETARRLLGDCARRVRSLDGRRTSACSALEAGLPELALEFAKGLVGNEQVSYADRWQVCKIEAYAHARLGGLDAWIENAAREARDTSTLPALAVICGLVHQERWAEAERQLKPLLYRYGLRVGARDMKRLLGGRPSRRENELAEEGEEVATAALELNDAITARDRGLVTPSEGGLAFVRFEPGD